MTRAKLDVVDRLDIQDLFGRYCFLIDENRGDEWAALFARDAVFDVPGLSRLSVRRVLRSPERWVRIVALALSPSPTPAGS